MCIKFLRNLFSVSLIILMFSCSSDDARIGDAIELSTETSDGSDPLSPEDSSDTNDTPSEESTTTEDGNTFISVWEVSDTNKTITLPIYDGTDTAYDFTVDWGDGVTAAVTSFDDVDRLHTYADAGEKTVSITGTLKGFNFFIVSESTELLKSITSWGDMHFGYDIGIFWSSVNLTTLPENSPDLSGISDLTTYFYDCSSFIGPVKNWDVSAITTFKNVFKDALLFNDDISGWDVSSANSLYGIFSKAISFNQDISGWDVSNVTNLYATFASAYSFNQDISGWDVSNVLYMNALFGSANSFNQDISGWDVSNVLKMQSMFRANTAFNQDLSGWATDNVYECSNFAATGAILDPAYVPTAGSCF